MIRKLAPHIIQNIAAGELVERPASVLKELIENSIDAEASQIKVEHEGGGIRLLRVSDNGHGIPADELELVFESHATSKIQFVEDLHKIRTMGFRGEAMGSIASVARVELWTSTPQSDTGSRAEIQFGKWMGKKPADRREGTEIVVRDLFEKLPARRKFLKSEASEARQLYQVFKRYALVYPEKQWSFFESSNRKIQLGPSTFMERCLWYFGESDPKYFFEAEGEYGPWRVQYMGRQPRYLQASRRGLLLFLNRRPIKDRSLEFAVRRAFEGFAENPQDVMGALFIEGSPEIFDVNVHPSKTEVRFQDASSLFSAIVHGIRSQLSKLHLPSFKSVSLSTSQENPKSELEPTFQQKISFSISSPNISSSNLEKLPLHAQSLNENFESQFEYLGSVQNTFWLAKRDESLFLFDQHALHERILYEQLMKEFKEKERLASQRLLFPIQLPLDEFESLLEMEDLLESFGFEIRQWDSSRLRISAVPAILKREYREALTAIAECEIQSRESFLRESLARIACHSALRAHDPVKREQAQTILGQFSSNDALGHCPHGRPTFIRFDFNELEKFFHRS